jgi:hypothetical protein
MPALPFQKRLERTSYDPELFKAISGLSIQGSQYAACWPRIITNAEHYFEMEVLAIGERAKVVASKMFANYGAGDDLYGCVPVALIQKALDMLEEKS